MALTDHNAAPYRMQVERLFGLGVFWSRAVEAVRGFAEFRQQDPRAVPRIAARMAIRDPMSFLSAQRLCIKDPLALYSAEWLADSYGAQVVVAVRHPVGVVSSYMLLGWPSDLSAIAGRYLPERASYLTKDIGEYRTRGLPQMDELILQWKILTEFTLHLKERRPDWLFIVHDTLCLSPVQHFRAVFSHLDLEFGRPVIERIRAETAATNVVDPATHVQHSHERNSEQLASAWKSRLPAEQTERIRNETEELWTEVLTTVSVL